MNQDIKKSILLVCPKCGHEWFCKSKKDRTMCSKCKKSVDLRNVNNVVSTVNKNDNIIDALSKSIVNPLKISNSIGDVIIHIIKDDNILLAFNDACEKKKLKDKEIIKIAVEIWLKQEGFL